MPHDGVKQLGRVLREARHQFGLSSYELADKAGVHQATVVRFEQGAYAKPDPEKIDRLATVLGLDLAYLLELAGYHHAADRSGLPIYLRAKYRHLPPPAQVELNRYFQSLTERYGIDDGPADHEDEE